MQMKRSRGILAGSLICVCVLLGEQAPTPPTTPPTAEVMSKDAPLTFKSGVNLVPVPVVIRDGKGHAIGNFGRDDFQLFDNGKLQMISKFSVEKLATEAKSPAATPTQTDKPTVSGETLVDANPEGIANRFVAYVFDDMHMSLADLTFTREAVRKRIDSVAPEMERTGIYTVSGKPVQDFTRDKEKLQSALAAINVSRVMGTMTDLQNTCPPMNLYLANQITVKGDPEALGMAAHVAAGCAHLVLPLQYPAALELARQAAGEASVYSGVNTQSSLETLRNLVARMSTMAGQRTIVLVSEGFVVPDNLREEQTALIERAIRSNVIISALDARGVHVGSSDESVGKSTDIYGTYSKMEDMVQGDEMATIADGTGGTYYRGSNNYDEGIARTAAAPEYLYVLGFSPLDLKLDGKYHNLKVTLKTAKGMDLEVRKGYYAPNYAASPEEQVKQRIEEAFFSREQVHDLPAALQTQYFKAGDNDTTLSAVAKIDVKKLNLRKDGGRNLDNLTVVTGLFDSDGNYISGVQKTVELRLLDDTLEKRVGSGIAVKSDFTVHTGKYVVRMVVRDSEGQAMAEQSSLVEIP